MAHLALLSLAALLLSACGDPPTELAELAGSTMGTGYTVKVYPVPAQARLDRLAGQIEQRLQAINAAMSTYQPDSQLSRFNSNPDTGWQSLPAEIVELVERAATISAKTDGAYDVTVNPLVALWGFGSAGRRDEPPAQELINARLADVGYRKLTTRQAPWGLRKQVPGLQVDLSSIAKGWAVDQIGAILEAEGINNYLVDIGGEVRARGDKGHGRPWQIAIERPESGQRTVQRVIALRDRSVATSGDYRNFFEHRGRRYSHTIDPRTGEALLHRLASVSVFADNTTDADAWATALMALGEVDGPRVAAHEGVAALFIVRGDSGLEELSSPALQRSGVLDTGSH